MLTVGVLTISDRGWRGEREDRSGEVIKRMLAALDAHIAVYEIVPDEKEVISLFENTVTFLEFNRAYQGPMEGDS